MAITIDDVKKIAKLVKLDISGKEEKLAQMSTDTIEYISMLDELDTQNVTETHQVTGSNNVFQQTDKGAENKTLTQDKALKNAKSAKNNLFETTGVFNR